MKLVYIYPEFTIKGGADKVIITKVNYFANHDCEVVVITESQMGQAFSFPLDSKVRHIDMGLNFNKQYRYGLIKRAFVYYSLMYKYRSRLTAVLNDLKADIVITTMGRSLDIVTSIHDGSLKIGEAHTTKKHLRSFHLLEQRGGIYKLVAKYMRRQMNIKVSQLDAIVLLTNHDAKNWNIAKQVFVIPNALPFMPPTSAGLTNKQIIMVGRYNEAKGFDYLIPAWDIVHQRHPDWLLNVYGSGELYDQVVRWIEGRELTGSVILHDPTNNIVEKYMESSICVLSSRYEGFSMVLLEAMSCGVPCVSFDCPYGPRTIINDGKDGLLIEYLSVQSLADGILKLIENENLRKQLGLNARTNVKRFSQDKVMKLWFELFNTLLKC